MKHHLKSPRLWVWIVYGVAVALGFFRVEQAFNQLEREAKADAYVLCLGQNTTNANIVAYLTFLGGPNPRAEQQAALEQAKKGFPQIKCPDNPRK